MSPSEQQRQEQSQQRERRCEVSEWFVHWELVLEATSCRVPQKVWWLGALFSLRVQKEKKEKQERES
jgi:hypothetical protein